MEWTRGPTIGRGSSATVSLATTTSGQLFAVKSTELSTSSFLQKEKHFLSQLSSPHIVKYMGFDITVENKRPMYNLFMEYVPGGTLSDEIKKQGGSLDDSMIRLYTHQILEGLDYIHSNGMVHCDMKGQNVLIGGDGVKIADLGCARLVEAGDATTWEFSGTPVFMAPEVARREDQKFPADIWALGCTIIEMATGSNPWPEANDPVSALYRIGYSGDLPEIPRWLSEEAKDFLYKCLNKVSTERWTAKQLLQHPFVNGLEWEINPQQGEEFKGNSPISVLDQGFWDSFEVTETSPNQTTPVGSSSNSPAERIRHLIRDTFSSDLGLSNWAEDEEDWVTVRSNQTDETEKKIQQICDMNEDDRELIQREPFLISIVNEDDDLEISLGIEDLLLECDMNNISSMVSPCIETNLDWPWWCRLESWVRRFELPITFLEEARTKKVHFIFCIYSSAFREYVVGFLQSSTGLL
ncbi:unnamed protein product [Ilex paraguariensis]|uniref:Protein kinase domain-containing protein n=1 Tax=Ilex paraguariensis TaxID=185542 RepID=A0ABC8RPQ5_9AQUA